MKPRAATSRSHARVQADRAAHDRTTRADVVQERLPRAAPPPRGLPGDQQFTEVDAVPGRMLVERGERRELPVHGRLRAVRFHRGQDRDAAVAHPGRSPQPGHELAEILQPRLPPVQPVLVQEAEVVLEDVGVFTVFGDRSMSVRYDRYRSVDPIGAPSSPRTVHDSCHAAGDTTR